MGAMLLEKGRRVVGSVVRATDTAAVQALQPDDDRAMTVAAAASEMSRGGWLWLGLTIVGAASKPTRTAVRDGLVAWAMASSSAIALKRAVQRRRPRHVVRSGSTPASSSMPSSQAAGAVAYATATTWRTPAVGLVAIPLAGLVVWSRAATGRHFPTDLAAGSALGLAAGTLVHFAARRYELWSEKPPPR